MAPCRTCGKTVTNSQRASIPGLQELYNSGNYKVVRYEGKNYTHSIGSPTGIIKYDGLTSYGRGKSGSNILAHVKDIEKDPDTFVVLQDKELEDALLELEIVQGVVQAQLSEMTVNSLPQKSNNQHNVSSPSQMANTDEEIVENKNDVNSVVEEKTEEATIELITKDNAMILNEYTEFRGYTHHLQVLTKVRSGEIYSFKKDNKTYIYESEQ